MKLSKTFWLILGIGLFVVAAVILYMFYQGEAKKQQEAEDTIAVAETVNEGLLSNNDDKEDELAQLEAELAQLEAEMAQRQITVGDLVYELTLLEDELSQLEDERAQAILQALALLDETAAKFISSIESIEYDEILFGFADDSDLVMVGLTIEEPRSIIEGDISYYNTKFTINVKGEVADLLGFINTVVTDDDFKTAVLEPIAIKMPETMTDEQKEDIKEEIRADLTEEAMAEAMTEVTTEDLVGFWVEAIEEVTGQEIETATVEEITAAIKEKIIGLVDEDIEALLPGDLAELIEEHIKGAILYKITGPLSEEIAALIVEMGEEGYSSNDLEALLGKDIADLLGEEIAGATQGDIAGLLNGYIAKLVEEKIMDSVAGLVDEELVEELVEERFAEELEAIEEQEMPSATITLNIYTYKGEGE